MKTIIICGLQRSGSTALFNIVRILYEHRNHDVYCSTASQYKPETKADLHLIKTHHIPNILVNRFSGRPILPENDVLFVTSHRDPRDAAASAIRMGWATNEAAMNYLELVFNWYRTSEPISILNMKYEDFKADPAPQIRYVVENLGFENSDTEIAAVIEELDQIKRQKVHDVYDPKTMMHDNHIGTGGIGIYKDTLTDDVAKQIEDRYRDWMISNGYLS